MERVGIKTRPVFDFSYKREESRAIQINFTNRFDQKTERSKQTPKKKQVFFFFWQKRTKPKRQKGQRQRIASYIIKERRTKQRLKESQKEKGRNLSNCLYSFHLSLKYIKLNSPTVT